MLKSAPADFLRCAVGLNPPGNSRVRFLEEIYGWSHFPKMEWPPVPARPYNFYCCDGLRRSTQGASCGRVLNPADCRRTNGLQQSALFPGCSRKPCHPQWIANLEHAPGLGRWGGGPDLG